MPIINSVFILIDPEDTWMLTKYQWKLNTKRYKKSGAIYLFTKIEGRTIYLHRLIMGHPIGQVKFLNDKNDFRKSNLVIIYKQSDKNISYTGKKFRARITINKVSHEIGSFDNQKFATEAIETFKQFMHTNS